MAGVRTVEERKGPAKFWVLKQLNILRLGRDVCKGLGERRS